MKWTEDDEKQTGGLEPEGIYPFEIVEAEEKISQNNNPYINLKLRVFSEGQDRTVYDVIMPQMPAKLRSFCEALGLMQQLKTRTLSVTDCGAGEGFVRMAKKLDKNDRVQVEAYLAHDPRGGSSQAEPVRQSVKSMATVNANTSEDDIPF